MSRSDIPSDEFLASSLQCAAMLRAVLAITLLSLQQFVVTRRYCVKTLELEMMQSSMVGVDG